MVTISLNNKFNLEKGNIEKEIVTLKIYSTLENTLILKYNTSNYIENLLP